MKKVPYRYRTHCLRSRGSATDQVDELWEFSDILQITPHEASHHHYVSEIWEIPHQSLPRQSSLRYARSDLRLGLSTNSIFRFAKDKSKFPILGHSHRLLRWPRFFKFARYAGAGRFRKPAEFSLSCLAECLPNFCFVFLVSELTAGRRERKRAKRVMSIS